MRRCFTDPHYWKNPALRRSREKLAVIAQTAWCLKQLQLAFPAEGFQANTTKLGTAFGRARPGIGKFRLFRNVSSYMKLCQNLIIPYYSGVC